MKKIIIGIIFLGVIGGFAALLWLLPIRQVKCFLDERELRPDFGVCGQLQSLIGSRMLLRDFYRDSQTASLLYLIQSKETFDIVRLEKSLSGTLTIYLSDQPPLYRIQADGTLVLVTDSGGFRENNDQVIVPLVIDQAGWYQREPAVHRFLADFLHSLGGQQARLSQIELVSLERIEVFVPGFPVVLLEMSQDPQQAAARLSLVLKELKPAEIDLAIRELDLRFELPVLRTAESSEAGQVLIDSQE